MLVFLTLTRRELGSFFVSFMGYVVIAVSVFLMGLCFYNLIDRLQQQPTSLPVTEYFFSFYFWMILLFSSPAITMRLFSLEKYSGTFETLMTAPISDLQVVFAKFTAALIFYMIMWLPLLGCILILRYVSHDSAFLDVGGLQGTFLAIFLLGCLYMSLGCFASALTSNQIIAAMTSFAMGISLYILSFMMDRFPAHRDWVSDTLSNASMRAHLQDFSHGIIDTRALVFYLSLTAFFLFLTYRVVESRRWK
jgi:ABC-2 type transport system permease protein